MGQAVSTVPSSSLGGSQPPSSPPVPHVSATTEKDNDAPSSTPVPQVSTTTGKDHDAELVRVFDSLDANADGRISASEIQELFGCTAEEAEQMVATVDSDGVGFISIEELGALMESGESDDALRKAFEVYDENGDGMITADELCTVLCRVLRQKDLTVEECSKMIAVVDKDGDGLISFDEFKVMMASKSP
ncbi:unnamed protein product [Alopecurus aequalis]